MKHNKQKNPGFIFEVINTAVMKEVADGEVEKAKQLFNLIREYFINKTEISKAYRIYSQLLYSEARNAYSAGLFIENLKKEYYTTINKKTLEKEINNLLESVDKITSRREIMKIKTPNYKVLASFSIALQEGHTYVSSRDSLLVSETLISHLLENKESNRFKEHKNLLGSFENKTKQEIQTERLSLVIALKKFDDYYGNLITKEQKDYLINYYSTSRTDQFKEWVCKRLDTLLDEIADGANKISDENIKRKIDLVVEKINKIYDEPAINSKNLKDILLTVEMKDKIKLF